jgi:D-aminoacyl-tRNA deacylase
LASTKKGNKPDFHKSAPPDRAKELYSAFFSKVQELYDKEKVKDGIFQAMMDVALVNDGPVGVSYTSVDGEVGQFCPRCAMLMDIPPGYFGDQYRSSTNGFASGYFINILKYYNES